MANHCDIKNSFFFYLISRHHQHVIFRQALGHTQENTFTHSHIQPLAKAPALIKHSCHLFTRKKTVKSPSVWWGHVSPFVNTEKKQNMHLLYMWKRGEKQ